MERSDMGILSIQGPDELNKIMEIKEIDAQVNTCLLYTSPSPRDVLRSRMPSSA